MTDDMSHREQLIAAAVAGELTPAEQDELDRICADDPAAQRELDEMMSLMGRLDASGVTWVEAAPDPALAGAVGRAVNALEPSRPEQRPRRALTLAVAASALLIAGAGVGIGGQRLLEESPPTGPAGTLGAVEQVRTTTEVAGADVDITLVAHTWGTETVLRVDGLQPGQVFDVVLRDREGRAVDSGAFLGSTVTIDCHMNAALMRSDVAAVQITEADGTVVVNADVPPVAS